MASSQGFLYPGGGCAQRGYAWCFLSGRRWMVEICLYKWQAVTKTDMPPANVTLFLVKKRRNACRNHQFWRSMFVFGACIQKGYVDILAGAPERMRKTFGRKSLQTGELRSYNTRFPTYIHMVVRMLHSILRHFSSRLGILVWTHWYHGMGHRGESRQFWR